MTKKILPGEFDGCPGLLCFPLLWCTLKRDNGSHVQAWQWIGSICLLTWGLLWASACSLEAWDHILGFLLLVFLGLMDYFSWDSITISSVNNFYCGLCRPNTNRYIKKFAISKTLSNSILIKSLFKISYQKFSFSSISFIWSHSVLVLSIFRDKL